MRASRAGFGILGMLAATSCGIENDLAAEVSPWGEANPPTLEPPVQEDQIRQVTRPMVDVLWVLDNSRSMKEEADKIAKNFPLFLDHFVGSGLDYHIGIISTNMMRADQSGGLQPGRGQFWLDEDTVDPAGVFEEMIPLYSGLSHEESGREAIWNAVEVRSADTNAGFFRDDAALHVIVISDEDDHSPQPTVPEFIDWLDGLKAPDRISFSSIVGIEVPCSGSFEKGVDYLAVTDAVGGFKWSICNEDWAPALDLLGLSAAGLKTEYFLSQLPVVDTIAVEVIDVDETVIPFPDGWTYTAERNSITFDVYVPDPLADVVITYELLSAEQID
jgi:hypothetical protein